jgi:death-on-curing protein
MVGRLGSGARTFEFRATPPINKEDYGYPSAGQLAGAYAFGLTKDHRFHDGNKRTALVVVETLFGLNGYELDADD